MAVMHRGDRPAREIDCSDAVTAPQARRFVARVLAVAWSLAAPGLAAGQPDVWLEAQVEPARVPVLAQAIYTLRLFQAIDVRELQLDAPRPALAELRPTGADHIGETTLGGRRYRVTERRYAVFPFASGELELRGATATGVVPAAGADAEPLHIAAPPTRLSVLPMPADGGDEPWLPARDLTLEEQWEPAGPTVRAGEPLRRTIRIVAVGLDAAQLPVLDVADGQLPAHATPPQLKNRFDGLWSVGTREQSWQLVASQPGKLQLPPLRLRWWDAASGRPRVAGLPARTLTVTGKAQQPEASSAPVVDVPTASAPAAPQASTPAQERTRDDIGSPFGGALRIGLGVAVLSLFAAIASVTARRSRPLRALRRACRSNDAVAARDALLALAALRWPERPPRTLAGLADRFADPMLRAALSELDRHLYGRGAIWSGHALRACARSLAARPSSRRSPPPALPPLYRPGADVPTAAAAKSRRPFRTTPGKGRMSA